MRTHKDILTRALWFGSNLGICAAFNNEPHAVRVRMREIMYEELEKRGWYSGDTWYPIAHPNKHPKKALCVQGNKYSIFTRYGRRRRTIAKLILKEFYS